MKGVALPFDFEAKGGVDLELLVKNKAFSVTDNNPAISSYIFKNNCFLNNILGEPTSVLDSARISSRPTSSSTLSSSFGGGGCGSTGGGGGGAASTDTAGVPAVSDANLSPKWQQDSTTATSSDAGGADSELLPVPTSLAGAGGNTDKCAMEDWENVLSESVTASPHQEQSIFRWIMGDAEDPPMEGLNKVLGVGAAAGGSTASEFDISGGFGLVDQGFAGDQFGANFMSTFSNFPNNTRSIAEKIDVISLNSGNNFTFPPNSQNLNPTNFSAAFDPPPEMKPPIFNPQLLINQHQAHHSQNPSFFLPFSQEHSHFGPPPAKRQNLGGPISKGFTFMDTGQEEIFMGKQQQQQQQQQFPQQFHLLPQQQLGHIHQQQQIIDQLFKAAELVQIGNQILAQGILARLNHHLSPIGKPFNRAAFYCKEALQLLLQTNNNKNNNDANPFGLVFKIGAYKSFSEISPLVQFTNFTCNQALLEVLDGHDRIHIVDFDIGYGGQWASLMQELALRGGGGGGGPPLLKITALTSPSTHDQLELGLARENLIHFASEINIGFEFEVISIDSLSTSSDSWALSESEAVAVNLPVGCLVNYQISVPLVLSFVKKLSPRIIVSIDRGCDRIDLPFANHIIHALQSYSNLLESLDAVNVNMEALQKIERFLLQPGFEKIVTGRFRSPEKSQHWRTLFLSSGFSPVMFSNFTESQAECVVKRTPVRGFQVEKRQSSLVLYWQRKELVSASVWRC